MPECRQEGAMKKLTAAGIAIGVLLVLSYTTVRPVAVQPGDQCFRCRRPIVETAMAAELMNGNRMASKFRAPGCLAKYVADHPEETGLVFVTDYPTGKWIRSEQARFVRVVVNHDTGESDYRAFFRKADADAAALALHTTPIDWKTVVSRAWRVS
jgi:hypothetical protein